ncbi:MAG: cadherin-like beta sandwich domain-containing protein, partial [Gammaproteobacteria bacterium]
MLQSDSNGANMRAPRFFRKWAGIAAALMVAVAGMLVAPPEAAAQIPAGKPAARLVPSSQWFHFAWAAPANRGTPSAGNSVRIRYRKKGESWFNPGGAAGMSASERRFVHVLVVDNAGGYINTFLIDPGEVHEAQVSYHNGVHGAWSDLQSVTIGTPFSPKTPAVRQSSGGFQIDWTPSGDTQATPRKIEAPGYTKHNALNREQGYSVEAAGYRVRWRKDGEEYAATNVVNFPASARTHTQTAGLTAGETYYVQVAGTNQYGAGLWTAELPVTTFGLLANPWVGKVGIEVRLALSPGATQATLRFRKSGQIPEAPWKHRIEMTNPTGHYLLGNKADDDMEPGVLYDLQAIEGISGWLPMMPLMVRSSTQNDVSPRLRVLAVTDAGGGDVQLHPAFSPGTLEYSVYLPNAAVLVNVTAHAAVAASALMLDGAALAANGEGAVRLGAGEERAVRLVATSALGGASTYALNVKRERLLALQVAAAEVLEELLSPSEIVIGDALPFRPVFSPVVFTYALSVSHHVSAVRLRMAASAAVHNIAYREKGDAVGVVNYPLPLVTRLDALDDSRLRSFALNEGVTEVLITLAEADGAQLEYLLRINRARRLFLPDMPQMLTAVPGAAKMVVAWRAPLGRHGADELPIGGYRLRWRYVPHGYAQDYGHWQDAAGDNDQGEAVGGGALSRTIAGRLYFLPHEVQVAAVNADGRGAWAAVSTAAVRVPAPDAAYTVGTYEGGAQLRVQLPLTRTVSKTGFVNFNTATVEDYGVQIKSADADWPEVELSGVHSLPAGVLHISTDEELARGTFRFSGFVAGRAYDARAFYAYHDFVTNRPAAGPFSPATRIATARPAGAPVVRLSSADGALNAEWALPGNAFVNRYSLRWKRGQAGEWAVVSAAHSPHMIINLENRQVYFVEVRAVNDFGDGPWSQSAQGRPGRTGAPADVRLSGADRALVVTWAAPPEIAGDRVSAYRIRWAARAAADAWLNAGGADGVGIAAADLPEDLMYRITGLVNRRAYLVQVAARNSIGMRFAAAVYAAPFVPIAFAEAQDDLRLHAGIAIERLDLPQARGGLRPYVYSLSGLPAGLRFTAPASSP